mgnify:CR=1 FL=1|jgi:hypothetical protein
MIGNCDIGRARAKVGFNKTLYASKTDAFAQYFPDKE